MSFTHFTALPILNALAAQLLTSGSNALISVPVTRYDGTCDFANVRAGSVNAHVHTSRIDATQADYDRVTSQADANRSLLTIPRA